MGESKTDANHRSTILFVEDTATLLELLVLVLERANFVVLAASNGLDALKLAEGYEEHIDVLLSDVKLPGLSGTDLASSLKTLRPDIQVILMSAFSSATNFAFENRWAYLQKPFTSTQLLTAIDDALEQSSSNKAKNHERECGAETGGNVPHGPSLGGRT
jgi:DNA-binding NtrC family response regulator